MKDVEFSTDYTNLLRQARALLNIVKSQEVQIEHYRKKGYKLSEKRLKELEESLESEKEMNSILTKELQENLDLI